MTKATIEGSSHLREPAAHVVFPGVAEGSPVVSPTPFPLSGVTFGSGGVINWNGHPLHGQTIGGKILVAAEVKGFAGGDWALLSLSMQHGAAPRAILCGSYNSFVVAGTLLARIPAIVGLSSEVLERISSSTYLFIDTSKGVIKLTGDTGNAKARISTINLRDHGAGELRLTEEDTRMLDGAYGEVSAECMEVITGYARAHGASRLIDIESVHLAGSGYNTTGDIAIAYLERLARLGGRTRVAATLNPIAVDVDRWQTPMQLPFGLAEKQFRLNFAFRQLGFILSYSCIPYWTSIAPHFGTNVAWSEHNAVSYANSVLGARTNFESNLITLMAAFTGRMPDYGLYKSKNRRPQVIVQVAAPVVSEQDWRGLGVATAQKSKDRIPLFVGLRNAPSTQSLRDLCASLGPPWCASPMLHIPGVTAEAGAFGKIDVDTDRVEETVSLSLDDLKSVQTMFAGQTGLAVDLVALGCPQYSLAEIGKAAGRLAGRHISPATKLWIWTDPATRAVASESGYVEVIERAGGQVLAGTCGCAACPLHESGHAIRVMATDSTKSCAFVSLTGIRTLLGSVADCIESAVHGHWCGGGR
ncbi:MAG: DUF521 domain-containing protein [Proteobacteria bacterium]|nr:DUF521 domain-containing protein [Pseudomonadota bacterium]